MELPERKIEKQEIKADIIAFRKNHEKSITENLKDHSEDLRERFSGIKENADLSKYFENEENILKLNFSADAYK